MNCEWALEVVNWEWELEDVVNGAQFDVFTVMVEDVIDIGNET